MICLSSAGLPTWFETKVLNVFKHADTQQIISSPTVLWKGWVRLIQFHFLYVVHKMNSHLEFISSQCASQETHTTQSPTNDPFLTLTHECIRIEKKPLIEKLKVLKQACSPEYQRAQYAFKDSMIHWILQFTLRIAFHCVLHRCESQEIHCQKLLKNNS